MKSKALIAVVMVAAFSLGCGNSPEKVCKKFAAMAEKMDKGDSKKKKSSSDDMDKCVTEMTKLKEKDPESFKKVGECLDKKDEEEAMKCVIGEMMSQAMKEMDKDKKKGDDDDKSDKADKKKKKGDDDDDSDKKKKKKGDDDDK